MKIATIIFVIVLVVIAFVAGFFFNSDKSELQDYQTQISNLQQANNQLNSQIVNLQNSVETNQESDAEKCIEDLTDYYENQPGVISTETGSILIGFKAGEKNQILSILREDYNLTVLQDYADFASFTVQVGEEIQQICRISHDEQIKYRIKFVEPDVLFTGEAA